jgi:uroporphyrinogen-III decarboxylase
LGYSRATYAKAATRFAGAVQKDCCILMTVTLNLKPEVQAKIVRQAAAEGKAVSDYLEKLIEETVDTEPRVLYSKEQLAKNQAALAMFDAWDREDETEDAEEIARRQAEWEEFKKGMNENHTSNRVIYP